MAAWRFARRNALVLLAGTMFCSFFYLIHFVRWTPWAAQRLVAVVLSGRCLLSLGLVPLLIGLAFSFDALAKRLNWRWLEWSPLGSQSNLVILPLYWRWVWLPYAPVLGYCMPFFALTEELIFRNNHLGWGMALLWGGPVFGLAHSFSFVKVKAILYLSLLGCIFVLDYRLAGLAAVFVLHTAYNLAVLGMCVASIHIKPPATRLARKNRWFNARFPESNPVGG